MHWLVTFIDYDLGYIDLESRNLQAIGNSFGPGVVTYVLDTFPLPMSPGRTLKQWRERRDLNPRPPA